VTDDIILDTPWARARGVIGRYPAPDERYHLVFDSVRRRVVHMVGVRQPLRVTFYRGDTVVFETDLRPWVGVAAARCDRIVEAPCVGA
jgi:hypothetical protein